MQIIYRISSGGYKKVKPDFATKQACMLNALEQFPPSECSWLVIADGLKPDLDEFVGTLPVPVEHVKVGHGAGTFCMAADNAMSLAEDEIIYFLEDDYLHQDGAMRALLEVMQKPVDYATLYDHPDKYKMPSNGGNPLCAKGGEDAFCFKTKSCWWRTTNSTTMTFAARVATLKRDWSLILPYVSGTHPYDFEMWIRLRDEGRLLASPMPSYSTHCETMWMADDQWGRQWKDVAQFSETKHGPS